MIFPPVLLMMDVSFHWSLLMWVWIMPFNSLSVNTVLDTLNSGNSTQMSRSFLPAFFFFLWAIWSNTNACSGCCFCVWSSSAAPGPEEEVGRQGHHRHTRDGGVAGLEKKIEELEKVRLLPLCYLFLTKARPSPPVQNKPLHVILY